MITINKQKIEELKNQYRQALDNINTEEDLKSLLDTAIKFNKYPFDNIVLIHNQNSDAEFLATIDVWNNQVGRYVNRGTKGLAVLEIENPKPTFKYLFELKNTNGNYASYKKVIDYKWEVKEEYTSQIVKNLNKKNGTNYENIREYLYYTLVEKIAQKEDEYIGNLEIDDRQKSDVANISLSCLEYILFKKCNLEYTFPNNLNFDSIKDMKVFSKMGSLATDISREILREIFIQVKIIEKEKERKGELTNGRETERSNEESLERRENDDRNNTNRLGDRVLRGRGDRTMVSDVGTGGGSGDRAEPSALWGDVEGISNGEQTPRDNNISNDRGTEQENVRDTGNGRELQGKNNTTTFRETTNATIGQDTRESQPLDTDTPNSRRNDNQGDNRESSIDEKIEYVKSKIGTEINLGDRDFTIYRVNDFLNEVELLPQNVSYPIFRAEPIEYIYDLLKELENENIKEPEEQGSFFVPKNEGIANLEKQEEYVEDFENELEEVDEIGDYNIPDEIDQMAQDIFNEEIFENQYYDNEITEDFSLDDKKNNNYIYEEEHNLYDGGIKTKCNTNIEIIKLLKQLETENRLATPEEQKILAGYNGFGGLANALTPNKIGFEEQYKTFKELLTEDEFKSAQKSTTTAFYTEQKIIKEIYNCLMANGFKQGRILDPSMGTGNFFSVLPKEMKNSSLYGIEIDSLSGRIARQLYPNANIEINGFEETNFKNNFFDLAISNIPFNNLQIDDKDYNKYNFKIHDYFIAKMIDKVRADGIVAVITTKGTLDKKDIGVRKYINERAELLGAIRLPNTAFKQIAGTEVTSDIIFFKKRKEPLLEIENNASWLEIGEDENGIPMNKYFIENSHMMLGKMVFDAGMYGDEKATACKPYEDVDLYSILNYAMKYIEFDYEPIEYEIEENTQTLSIEDNSIRNFSYGIIDDEIYFKEDNELIKQDFDTKNSERLKGLINVNTALRDIIDFQTSEQVVQNYTIEQYDKALKEKIEKLNTVYDDFIKKYGYVNSKENTKIFAKDIGQPLLLSIEKEIKNTKDFEKTDIFYKPTIRIKQNVIIENADDALKVCLNDIGRVDISYMKQLYHKEEDEIIEELGDKIFRQPAFYDEENKYEGYVTADEYLTGYVKDKLLLAKDIATHLPEFEKNVQALEKVQPTPLKPEDIGFTLGSTWIPKEIYKDFINETLELTNFQKSYIKLNYYELANEYFLENKKSGTNLKCIETYGTKRKNALEIIEDTLNLRPVKVNDKKEVFDEKTNKMKKVYVINHEETVLAKAKQEQLKNEFVNWVFRDSNRVDYLTNIYNEKFNNYVTRTYDGSNLELPNMSSEIELRDYQKNVIARVIYSNSNTLIAHEVGAGKSATRS